MNHSANEAAATTDSDLASVNLWRRYRRLPRNVVAIGLVSLLNDASSEIIYPLLPLFLSLTLSASPAAVGIIEGAAESVSSLLKLFAGYFSDKAGRRKPLVVFGYTLANAVRPFIGFTTAWWQVLTIRLTDRVGKGVRSAPRDAMIADATDAKSRGLAFGFHRAMDHTGAVIGPLIGYGLVAYFAGANDPTAADFRKIFLIASVPALFAVLMVVFGLRETVSQAEADRRARQAHAPSLSLRGFDSNFKTFLMLVAVFTLSNSSDAFLLLRARETGMSTTTIMLLWAALHVSKVLSSLVGGGLSDKFGRKALIVSGWLLYAAVYIGFAFVRTPAEVWALFLIYGLYFGMTEGVEKALVADLVKPGQRGTAFGLYNLAFGVTVLPASLWMGAIWKMFGAETAFIVSACVSIIAALCLALVINPHPRAIER